MRVLLRRLPRWAARPAGPCQESWRGRPVVDAGAATLAPLLAPLLARGLPASMLP
jgi:hypothetical protein